MASRETVLNSLLRLSLKDISLRQLFEEALDLVLRVPWLSPMSRGAIFLVDGESRELVLEVMRGVLMPTEAPDSPMPFERPLCGKAIETRRVQYANYMDHPVEWRSEGNIPHGHYCVPILMSEEALGVLSLCLEAGHSRDAQEEKFLAAIADTLAGMILRKRSEDALRASNRALELLIQAVPLGIAIVNPTGIVQMWNPAATRIFSWSKQEVLGRPLPIIPEEEWDGVRSTLHRMLARGQSVYEKRRRRKRDGSLIDVSISAAPMLDARGKVSRIVVIYDDITAQMRLQKQLLRAQRLETAGRIAGQVAHDFNNLLTSLVAYPDLIKMELPEGHPASRLCDMMQRSATQMADINSQLLTLGRRGRISQEPTDLNCIVEQAASQLSQPPRTPHLSLDLCRDLQPVLGSSAQLLRLATNLISNALDATGDAGHLAVKTENYYLDRPLNRYNRVEVGEYVKLTVSDNGCGIPSEIKDRIFDAFFSTKRADGKRGAGLGLSVVQAIAEDHRGYVDLESEVGKGSSFYVYLPACRQPIQKALREELPAGHETILVVDDDPIQRDVAGRALGRLGYRVESAGSGEEAIAHLREKPADLLILDMIMPGGLDGVESYRRALQIRPGQRAIMVSGFAETDRVQEAFKLGAGQFLPKPVSLERLARAVRREMPD